MVEPPSAITCVSHARLFTPFIVIAQEPQIPLRHDLLNVSVPSCSHFILLRASSRVMPF